MPTNSEIYSVIYNEMNIFIDKMNEDFKENYEKKRYNWTLTGFSPKLISYMAFVSSFESKQGNMFENIIRGICELNYGKENVPTTIKGVGITDEEYENHIKNFNKPGQYIISKFNKKGNEGALSQFRANREAHGRGKKRIPSLLTQSELSKLLEEDLKLSDKILNQAVDLIFYDKYEHKWKLFEIKAGGNLDNSNAAKNVEKMLKIYASFGRKNSNLYYATLYHKDGEGNTWKGGTKKHISEECILIGKAFWKQVLRDVPYDDFTNIYQKAFDDINFNDRLIKIIDENAQ
ncbi:MAG: TdeIII family type II restriction endonuclease [Methanobrevibacter sp.]|jgi:hypothetical protein|nr:TdeIII family type II restriction endonuclease [Methanobrevibacter sp.]